VKKAHGKANFSQKRGKKINFSQEQSKDRDFGVSKTWKSIKLSN